MVYGSVRGVGGGGVFWVDVDALKIYGYGVQHSALAVRAMSVPLSMQNEMLLQVPQTVKVLEPRPPRY